MIKDFSVEVAMRNGFPVQTFKERFSDVWEMFRRSTLAHGEKEFLVEGENRVTFKETSGEITRLAAFLKRNMGIQKGEHVGILMENSIAFVVSFFAIQKLGATAVVFNTRLAVPELCRQIQISGVKVWLATSSLAQKVEEVAPHFPSLRHRILKPGWEEELGSGEGGEEAPPVLEEDDVALILFTSGTVGAPKGVMITHRNLITSAFKQGHAFYSQLGLKDGQTYKTVIAAPLFHVLALQEQLMASVFLGLTCILVATFKPQEIVNLFQREQINILAGTPTMYWLLLHKTPMKECSWQSIKVIFYGGAPMPPDLLQELRQTFPGVKCLNGYGLTEASVISILQDEFCESHPTSVGRPALGSEVKVVDLWGKELEAKVIGELVVRGALVSKGYYKMPEETERFYHEGWFYTGDMAYQDAEGFIYLVGRTREMINRGGENVYPVEVENILHLHPKILDVAVLGVPDPVLGEGVGCAVVLRPGEKNLPLEEIQEFCQKYLADYKIPQNVFLVADLPRNPGGKVMKKTLLEQILNRRG